MHCHIQLAFVHSLAAAAATLLLGAIASCIVAMALAGFPLTAVFGGAATALGVSILLFLLAVGDMLALAYALGEYDRCMGRPCRSRFDALTRVLVGAFPALAASVYTAAAAAGIVSWIPYVSIPPLGVLLALLILTSALVAWFSVLFAEYLQCVFDTYGSVTDHVRVPPSTSGGPGGGGTGGPGLARALRPDRPREIFEQLSRGTWVRRWPGATIDGSLGPDVCPICIYAILVGGEISRIEQATDQLGPALVVTGGELIAVDASGRSVASPIGYVGIAPASNRSAVDGLVVQGVVVRAGRVEGVIAGERAFDFEPYLDRQ